MFGLGQRHYVTTGGIHLPYDFYRPDNGETLPLVVFLHGGGWISGDRSMFQSEARQLAELGFATAAIEYRLAPLYCYPSQIADVQAFLAHARDYSDQLGIDPNQIATFGNSAGGYLATMSGICRDRHVDSGDTSIHADAVVSVCGISDLSNKGDEDFGIALSFLEQYIGATYHERPELYTEASPLEHVSEKACPFLIFHGTADEVVAFDQSVQLAEKLRSTGTDVTFIALEGENHSFTAQAYSAVWQQTIDFLCKQFEFQPARS